MAQSSSSLRTRLFADPEGKFVHDVGAGFVPPARVQDRDRRHFVHTRQRRITYAAYGEMVETAARGWSPPAFVRAR